MTVSIGHHFRIAWTGFTLHWRVFCVALLIAFTGWIALEVAVVSLHRWGVLPWLILHILFGVVFSGLMAGIQCIASQIVEGLVPTFASAFAAFDRGPTVFLAGVIYVLAVTCGLLLFVIPGIYIAVRYAAFWHLAATQRVSAVKALRQAAALTQDQWWGTCRLFTLLVLLNIAGAAVLGVGLFISVPMSALVIASVFWESRVG